MIEKVKKIFMLETLKSILWDIQLIYKNFFHWNISKILIYICSILLGILLSVPFILILAWSMYFDPIPWKEVISSYYQSGSLNMSLLSYVYNNMWILIGEAVLLLSAFLFFIFWYSYKTLTFTNIYFWYITGEKIPYFKNIYFHIQTIFSYIKLLSLVIVTLLIPILIFWISFFILIYIFWWIEMVFKLFDTGNNTLFSIILWIIAFICLFVFMYLAYRLSFSYMILLDKNNYADKKWISFYIKESFHITSWLKIFKFLYLMILFSLCMLPLNYLGESLKNVNMGIIFLYDVVIFLTISWLFEMYMVSIYQRIMLYKKEVWTDIKIQEENIPEREWEQIL